MDVSVTLNPRFHNFAIYFFGNLTENDLCKVSKRVKLKPAGVEDRLRVIASEVGGQAGHHRRAGRVHRDDVRRQGRLQFH
jgi:hypothetical protein